MLLYIIRHGETDWNIKGRLQGNVDTALNETGRRQAELTGERLKESEISAIYTSDLGRAVETAEIINRQLKASIIKVPGLREIRFGEWEGKQWDEIMQSDSLHVERWRNDRVHVAPPGGESFLDLKERLTVTLDEILPQASETFAIITHGGVLKALVCMLLELDLAKQSHFTFANCGVSIFRRPKKHFELVTLNEFSHLKGS